jgi:hypothetical protein
MSTFKGLDLFGPGPHEVTVGPRGSFVLPDAALGSPGPNSYAVGVRELDLAVEGRLVAASLAALEAQRDAVAAQLLNPPTAGTLVDPHGRAWAGLSFISFEERGPVERGRVWSLAYTARFRRFNAPPA